MVNQGSVGMASVERSESVDPLLDMQTPSFQTQTFAATTHISTPPAQLTHTASKQPPQPLKRIGYVDLAKLQLELPVQRVKEIFYPSLDRSRESKIAYMASLGLTHVTTAEVIKQSKIQRLKPNPLEEVKRQQRGRHNRRKRVFSRSKVQRRKKAGRHLPQQKTNDITPMDEDMDHDEFCFSCGQEGEALLMCDHCVRVYHLYCLDPPLAQVPEGDWKCPLCVGDAVGGPKRGEDPPSNNNHHHHSHHNHYINNNINNNVNNNNNNSNNNNNNNYSHSNITMSSNNNNAVSINNNNTTSRTPSATMSMLGIGHDMAENGVDNDNDDDDDDDDDDDGDATIGHFDPFKIESDWLMYDKQVTRNTRMLLDEEAALSRLNREFNRDKDALATKIKMMSIELSNLNDSVDQDVVMKERLQQMVVDLTLRCHVVLETHAESTAAANAKLTATTTATTTVTPTQPTTVIQTTAIPPTPTTAASTPTLTTTVPSTSTTATTTAINSTPTPTHRSTGTPPTTTTVTTTTPPPPPTMATTTTTPTTTPTMATTTSPVAATPLTLTAPPAVTATTNISAVTPTNAFVVSSHSTTSRSPSSNLINTTTKTTKPHPSHIQDTSMDTS